MAKRRALIDTVKDPIVKKETAVTQFEQKKADGANGGFKLLAALLLGFAGGLLTGRFIKII
jgi:hypothetical protein